MGAGFCSASFGILPHDLHSGVLCLVLNYLRITQMWGLKNYFLPQSIDFPPHLPVLSLQWQSPSFALWFVTAALVGTTQKSACAKNKGVSIRVPAFFWAYLAWWLLKWKCFIFWVFCGKIWSTECVSSVQSWENGISALLKLLIYEELQQMLQLFCFWCVILHIWL